jgi:Protein of unknown function (DUF4043)
MALTNISTVASGEKTIDNNVLSEALFIAQIRRSTLMNNLSGKLPAESDTLSSLKSGATTSTMPVIKATDLTVKAGSRLTVHLMNVKNVPPTMGAENIEGKGEKLTHELMNVDVQQARFAFSGGSESVQQRTTHNLKQAALSSTFNNFNLYQDLVKQVHLSGARGSQGGDDWDTIPLQSASSFKSIMINPVTAPTYNRHYVIDGSNLVQGGEQLGLIDSADVFTLNHIDDLSYLYKVSNRPLGQIKVEGDAMAEDNPIGMLLVDPHAFNDLRKQATGQNIREYEKYTQIRRDGNGGKVPAIFLGEGFMWRNMLVKPMTRSIWFEPGDQTNIITAANRATRTETAQTIAALPAGFKVVRSLLLGGQALIEAWGGRGENNGYFNISEKKMDHDDKYEVALKATCGQRKVSFDITASNGTIEPTDYGVAVIDCVSRPVIY